MRAVQMYVHVRITETLLLIMHVVKGQVCLNGNSLV